MKEEAGMKHVGRHPSLSLLTGGARSGKSAIAVRRALAWQAKAPEREVTFVATGQAGDDEMADRIARHQSERPRDWHTIEAPLELAAAVAEAPPEHLLVVDCLALWVSNLIGGVNRDAPSDERSVVEHAQRLASAAVSHRAPVIVVTNEVGLGLVPMHPLGRAYRDLLGRVNAVVAQRAALAELVVAGRTLTLDPPHLGDIW